MTILTNTIVVDLDDTLYPEIDYLKSAYSYIACMLSSNPSNLYDIMIEKYQLGENVFDYLESSFDINKADLLNNYRFHKPDIKLHKGALEFLETFSHKYNYSIITDGRSKTQRNKIKALGIESFFSNIIISEEIGSEKPNIKNFQLSISNLNSKQSFYIGDNTSKDFITPNRMGWITICLKDSGQNIHKQDFTTALEYQPHHIFESWSEILNFFKTKN